MHALAKPLLILVAPRARQAALNRILQASDWKPMTFIDFSDPEDMFELLIDYVTDELSEAKDSRRRKFLSGLLDSLLELQDQFAGLTPARRIESLREMRRSIDSEFEGDPVAQHLEDCATECERLADGP